MKKLCFTLVVAAVLWAVMFSPQTMPLINFWEMMAGSALTLAVLACLFDRSWLKESVWNPQSLLLGIAPGSRAVGRVLDGRQGGGVAVRLRAPAGRHDLRP